MKHTEWTKELAADLAAPFPINQHTQKGGKGTFVSVRHYVQRLDELVGPHGWSMPQPATHHAGAKLGICVGVTILGVTKWNFGDEVEDHGDPIEFTDRSTGEVKEKVVDFGTSYTNAWAQGFKRCLAYGFGMGRYMYDKDWTKQYLGGKASAPTNGNAGGNGNGNGARSNTQSEPEAKCPVCSGRMWDNRESKTNPRAPDFKCRKKQCEGQYWPGEWPPVVAATDESRNALRAIIRTHFVNPAFDLDDEEQRAVAKATKMADWPEAQEPAVQSAIQYLNAVVGKKALAHA